MQFGFPEQWIRILGDRIRKVHVKDFNTATGNMTGFVPLLAGDVNWREVSKALKEIRYEGALTAELTAYALDPQALAFDTARHIDLIMQVGEEGYNELIKSWFYRSGWYRSITFAAYRQNGASRYCGCL